MKCPNCGADNSDQAFYCGRCAAALRDANVPSGVKDIEMPEPRALNELTHPFRSSISQMKEAAELAKAARDAAKAQGIELPKHVVATAVLAVGTMIIGAVIIGLAAYPFLFPWEKSSALLPSYFLIIGPIIVVGGFALILLIVWMARRRSKKMHLAGSSLLP